MKSTSAESFSKMNTLMLNAINKDEIKTAAAILAAGGLVAMPTETVYGLAANALKADSVENIFKAKGRPQDNPLIVHIADENDFAKYGYPNEIAKKLAKAFWPGPLTIIVDKNPCIPDVTSGGLATVGIRMPAHPVALELIREAGVPVAAPSANTSGKPSPTEAVHVWDDMNGKIEAVLDGGSCDIGVESTVVDTTNGVAVILRPGAITIDMMAEVLGEEGVQRVSKTAIRKDEAPKSPGMKYRHYAPKAQVNMICGTPVDTYNYIKENVTDKDGVLVFSEFIDDFSCEKIDFGMSYDKDRHAHVLFSAFRELDKKNVEKIYVQCPREYGKALATVNRLRKSAEGSVTDLRTRRIVGVVGRSGSGKSYISQKLSENGRLIDCDKLYAEMLKTDCEMTRDLAKNFPESYVDGKIVKAELAKAVFNDREKLEKLNKLTHSHIVKEIMRIIDENPDVDFWLDAPTLFESGLHLYCTKLVAVVADEETCIERIMKRDSITEEQAKKRLANQMSADFFKKYCDQVIYN